MLLNKKVVYITGGSSGIGQACAKLCLKNGAMVIITGRNIEKLEEAKILAPHIKNQFISIKEFTINEHTDDGYNDSFSSIFGILDIDGKLFMVPLKN